LAKLSQAGQELYINQLKTLLTEAKEELKVCSTCRTVVLGLRGNVVSFFCTVG
jgi:recombinational DNA repair protein RecR